MTQFKHFAELEKLVKDTVYQEMTNIIEDSFDIEYIYTPHFIDGEKVDENLTKTIISFTIEDLVGERDYSLTAYIDGNDVVYRGQTRTKLLLGDPFDNLVVHDLVRDFFDLTMRDGDFSFKNTELTYLLGSYPIDEFLGSKINKIVRNTNGDVFKSLLETIENELFKHGSIVSRGFLDLEVKEKEYVFNRNDKPSFSLSKDKKSIITLAVYEESDEQGYKVINKTGLVEGDFAYDIDKLYELCDFVYGLKGSYISDDTWEEAIDIAKDLVK